MSRAAIGTVSTNQGAAWRRCRISGRNREPCSARQGCWWSSTGEAPSDERPVASRRCRLYESNNSAVGGDHVLVLETTVATAREQVYGARLSPPPPLDGSPSLEIRDLRVQPGDHIW